MGRSERPILVLRKCSHLYLESNEQAISRITTHMKKLLVTPLLTLMAMSFTVRDAGTLPSPGVIGTMFIFFGSFVYGVLWIIEDIVKEWTGWNEKYGR